MASEHQEQLQALIEQGYSVGEAQGRVRADEADYTPPPGHGVDEPDTNGYDRPGPGPNRAS